MQRLQCRQKTYKTCYCDGYGAGILCVDGRIHCRGKKRKPARKLKPSKKPKSARKSEPSKKLKPARKPNPTTKSNPTKKLKHARKPKPRITAKLHVNTRWFRSSSKRMRYHC
jgi:hypothetical protein